jgi:Bacterial SH3 domain
MQYLSNSNASTTIGGVKSSLPGNLASARLARFAETEATRAMQFKQNRNFSKVKSEARQRIRLVETALRDAAQGRAPQASSGNRHGDRQLLTGTPSSGAIRFTKSRIVAVISLALVLPTFGVAVWLGVTPLADMSQQSPIPSPVLTAPAFLEATAGENILLPIALDGTDGVPAHSSIAITGLPQGSTLSKGRPFGDTGWKLERDEIGDLQLYLPSGARGQAKLAIQLVAPDATLVADAETVLQVATASQSLPRNAEDTNDAPFAPVNQEPALFGMPVSGVTPEITDAQVAHESPEGQPDPGLPEAKPSAAVAEREEEPVQAKRRIVQSQRRAPAKRPVANVGTNEVKTSVSVNLRQGPSPSAKVIRVVAKGTKLRVVARKGRWAQVTDPATSAKGWLYTGNANPPRSTKPSAPAEPSENTQPKPDSVDTQPKSDSIWPSFLRGRLASR